MVFTFYTEDEKDFDYNDSFVIVTVNRQQQVPPELFQTTWRVEKGDLDITIPLPERDTAMMYTGAMEG